jgi:uroporphyrinogen-III synthase
MFNAKYSILSTKALHPDLVKEAAEHGIAIDQQTFIDITPVLTEPVKMKILHLAYSGGVMVFTSPNAVNVVAGMRPTLWGNRLSPAGERMPDRRIYCLEGATRQAVEEQMASVLVAGTAANSAELARKIIEDKVPAVVFFCGNIRRNELPDMLRAHDIEVEEQVVYQTTETPAVLDKAYNGILFLSPSSVRSFFSANTPPAHTVCFAIGETTAGALRDVTDNKVIVSHRPSVSSLLGTAIYYFDNINCYE